MKFFVDTANLDQIQEVNGFGILDGVTTNPSLMAKEGIKGIQNVHDHYRKISDLVDGDISAEVIATVYEEMLDEGRKLAGLAENIVVKVPMTKDGVRAISTFRKEGIRTNCTLIFSPAQALMAAKAGATYVSPFMGRLDDISFNGIQLIQEIVDIFSNYAIETQVLAASVRSTLHIVQCAQIGADVVTCPSSVILQMLNHPLTDIGLEKFLADHRKLNDTL
ncbi:MAG: fructose-6-phosphate aldolase [Sphingobacteriales bacterium]|nr:MAG: fructose-6-phosphate aldolase [Sphingobacteriales bacterium]